MHLDKLIAQLVWIGMKDKRMKETVIQKLNNIKRKLTTEIALEIIQNTTAGEKATGWITKKLAAAPKQNQKKEHNTKRYNYCYRSKHTESECFLKPGGKFNINGKKQRPERPKGWKEYKEQ